VTDDPKEHLMNILVTGGTGTLGKPVVARLYETEHAVRVLSRRPSENGVAGDLETGEGVDAALEDVDVVVHCAGSRKGDEVKASTLVQAAARARVRHVVNISVVGADRIPVVSGVDRAMFGYFASKLAAEHVVAESGLPWTTLRAAQFHELMLATAQAMTKLPVVPVPAGTRFQPVAADEVADRLVEHALGAPAGLVPDIAGPRVLPMGDLLRAYLRACGKHRPLIPVWQPGKAARAFRAGANLAPDHAVGRLTWEDFLERRGRDSNPRSA
jgi:uncharacterized protein YbjT (DUF2867 family)